MNKPGPWDELESCPTADEELWQKHVEGFVTAFIVPAKRERWLELLTRRPRRIGRDSHKMHSDLDRRTCCKFGSVVPPALKGDGLFYGFHDVPRVVSVELAAQLTWSDAILSLVPGKLALYFFHEGEVWLCQAGGTG
jgi:hypothetical protein